MADMESICARLCLLTRAAWKENLPAPLPRKAVSDLVRLGALQGLTLRTVDGIEQDVYARAEALLSRSSLVYDEAACCAEKGFRIMLPEDEDWPQGLAVLGECMPQFLFIRGQETLLRRHSVAVAGSRVIQTDTVHIAQAIGKRIAAEGFVMVSGGAQGVDTAAQSACLKSEGCLILVPAYPCAELLKQAYLSRALDDGRLLVLCDTWPDEPFSAQKALSRNHTIYALASASVVVASRHGVGGSWRGAADSLQGGYAPVFVVDAQGRDFMGNRALLGRGAKPLNALSPLKPQLFGSEV